MLRLRNWLLLLIIPFLGACSTYEGVAGEYYGGKKIEVDQELLASYQTNRMIPAEELSEESIRYFLQPSLPTPKKEVLFGLTKYSYEVGRDVPAGRYQVQYEGYDRPDIFIVRNASGEVVYQQMVNMGTSPYELTLHDGQTIEGTTDAIASNILINKPLQETSDTGEKTLSNGIWHVGTDIDPGSYTITLPQSAAMDIPYLTVVTKDQAVSTYELLPNFSQAIVAEEDIPEPLTISIELEEGSALILEDAFPIVLTPKP